MLNYSSLLTLISAGYAEGDLNAVFLIFLKFGKKLTSLLSKLPGCFSMFDFLKGKHWLAALKFKYVKNRTL